MAFLINRSIKSSLLFAFGLLCGFTILSSSIGLYANSQLRADYEIAVEEKIPAIASMVHLSTEAVLLTHLVPQLYNADTDNIRRKYWRRIQDSIDLINLRLQYMLADIPLDEDLRLTIDQFHELKLLIAKMNDKVTHRIIYRQEIAQSHGHFIALTQQLAQKLELHPNLDHQHALTQNISNVAKVDKNLLKLKAIEATNNDHANAIFGEAEIILDSVNYKIGEYVNKIQIDSILSSQAASNKIKLQHLLMICIMALSIFFSIFVMWLYVKRRLLDRIQALNYSMSVIASGDLEYKVPVTGSDEIGHMAGSLISFREQLHEKQFELVQASKLAAIGQLSTGISHEINQPLAAISHYSRNGSRMIDGSDLDGASQNFDKIAKLVKKATKITSRLKSIARKPQEKLYQVNLNESVKNALEIAANHPGFKCVDIAINIDSNRSAVLAEQVQLEQVILNLVTNAIDALEIKEGAKCIIIGSRRAGDFIYLDITDNGMGVAADLQSKIFDPFFTTKNTDKGLGLGLAISYSIIKSFGGNIRLHSHIDQGSTFTAKLVATN